MKLFLKVTACAAAALSLGLFSANADPITIDTIWNYGTASPDQQVEINTVWSAVVDYYENIFIGSYSGETWTINANWTNISQPGAIASASPDGFVSGATLASLPGADLGKINTNVEYANALADQLANQAYVTNTSLTLTLNSSLTNWDFSTTTKAPGTESLFTTAVHEIGHGLGFLSSVNTNDGAYALGEPTIFDAFLALGNNPGTNLVSMTDAQRLSAITSDNIYFSGSNAVAGQDGPVQIYAPASYEDGSSMSHLDFSDSSTESLIMFPSASTNPENFSYGPTELGIYQDLGYTVVPEPSSGGLLVLGGGLMLLLACRLRHRTKSYSESI